MNNSIYIPALFLVGVLCSMFIVISIYDVKDTVREIFETKHINTEYEQVYNEGGSLRKTATSTNYVNLPKGLYPVREWIPFNLNGAAVREDPELAFYSIQNDWSFDDAVTKKFGCIVRAFDPTMKNYDKATKRGDKIYFYPIGISGNNTMIEIGKYGMCHVKTSGSLRKQFQEEEKMIDYLKMDVEGSEWSSLEAMFKEGFLTKYVKQIGIEYHSYQVNKKAEEVPHNIG
ncbi:hypothetical protein LSH36_1289g00085 [Paralvinella palmiformis]|uniref:Methyltransferase domain-containing protein n=1 Tax=Paralvinella palmiformis TaxID=53620 RepID=A0AAD9ITD7_9ANNE|nr:hypothetical protein LSH36_1289g00085 [Paralvinella palmiformis]